MFVDPQCVDTANTCGGVVCGLERVFVVVNSTHCIYFAHVDSRSVGSTPDGYFGALVQLGDR